MTHRHLRQPDVALILETWHRRDRHGDCASLARLRYPLLRRHPRRSQCRAVRQFRPSAFDRRLLDMRRTHRRSLCPGDESRLVNLGAKSGWEVGKPLPGIKYVISLFQTISSYKSYERVFVGGSTPQVVSDVGGPNVWERNEITTHRAAASGPRGGDDGDLLDVHSLISVA